MARGGVVDVAATRAALLLLLFLLTFIGYPGKLNDAGWKVDVIALSLVTKNRHYQQYHSLQKEYIKLE